MRKGFEILEKQIGQKLKNGLFQSFFLNDDLVDNINVLYLKFDKWIHITTTDETTVLEVNEDKPKQIIGWTEDDGTKFEYPLTALSEKFNDFDNYIDLELEKFSELVDKEFTNIVCGVKLYFRNGLSLIAYSNPKEDTFVIFNGEVPIDLKEKNAVTNKS